MQITRSSTDAQKGPADRFTGDVYIDAVAAPAGSSTFAAALVHFAPGARTAWHTHPYGHASLKASVRRAFGAGIGAALAFHASGQRRGWSEPSLQGRSPPDDRQPVTRLSSRRVLLAEHLSGAGRTTVLRVTVRCADSRKSGGTP
jgi:hypothetical protein